MTTLTEETRADIRRQARDALDNFRAHGPSDVSEEHAPVILCHGELLSLLDAADESDMLEERVEELEAANERMGNLGSAIERERDEALQNAEHAESEFSRLRARLDVAVKALEEVDGAIFNDAQVIERAWAFRSVIERALATIRAGQQETCGTCGQSKAHK